VRGDGRGQDVDVQPPSALLRDQGSGSSTPFGFTAADAVAVAAVVGIHDEVPRIVIRGKGVRQRQRHLAALGHADGAHGFLPARGDEGVLLERGYDGRHGGRGRRDGRGAGAGAGTAYGRRHDGLLVLGLGLELVLLIRFNDGFSDIFRMLSPVWTLESCVLETDMNLDGWRRQLRAVRMSADINVVFLALIPFATG
jgi:hypothetical protein